MKRALRITGWIAATILLIYLIGRVDQRELRQAMDVVRWRWIFAAIFANALIMVSWAGLWWVIAPDRERPRYGVMFQINAMASALMNTMPFLGGHAAAVVLLIKRGMMSREGALSVLALDQLGEGCAKLAIFGMVAALAPIPDWMRVGILSLCIAVATLFVILIAASHGHGRLRSATDRAGTISRIRNGAADLAERMETLRSVRRSVLALLFAIGTKVAEGLGLLAVQAAFGVELSVGSTALVLAAVILGSILPVAPGNVGTYEAGAFVAYRHLGLDPAQATILAVASHVCFMIPSVGIGYLLGSWSLVRAVPATSE